MEHRVPDGELWFNRRPQEQPRWSLLPTGLGGSAENTLKSHLGEVRQDADRQPQDLESFTRVRGLGALGFPS